MLNLNVYFAIKLKTKYIFRAEDMSGVLHCKKESDVCKFVYFFKSIITREMSRSLLHGATTDGALKLETPCCVDTVDDEG